MATRIYSLAKDLGLDNKELVEIVKKAGISGKGSALASLEDEEVDKVKQFMDEGSSPASAESPLAMTRPEASTQTDIKVVTSRSQPAPDSPTGEEKENTEEEEIPSEPVPDTKETTAPEAPTPLSREDVLPRGDSKIKVITSSGDEEDK